MALPAEWMDQVEQGQEQLAVEQLTVEQLAVEYLAVVQLAVVQLVVEQLVMELEEQPAGRLLVALAPLKPEATKWFLESHKVVAGKMEIVALGEAMESLDERQILGPHRKHNTTHSTRNRHHRDRRTIAGRQCTASKHRHLYQQLHCQRPHTRLSAWPDLRKMPQNQNPHALGNSTSICHRNCSLALP